MDALALLLAAGGALWWQSGPAAYPSAPGRPRHDPSSILAEKGSLSGGAGRTAVMVSVLAIAVVAGTTLPDLDQVLPLGGHRSALSHSLLPALLCLHRRLRPLAFGLAFGLALHLSADLFPRAMCGFALVRVPAIGTLGRDGSRIWLALNVIGGFALATGAASLIHSPAARLGAAGAAAAYAITYLAGVPGGWWAITLFAAIGWTAWRWRR